VIRPIENTDALGFTQQPERTHAVPPATPAARSFASVFANEKRTAGEIDNVRDARAPKHPKTPIDAPEGEVWRPVRNGDKYAKIVDGPRDGQYVNLSRGARHGQVFRVEDRDGVRVHVYGDGDAEKVVEALKDSGRIRENDDHPRAARVPKNERWAPVNGVSNYADILNGSRNGYYVNTSGGVRDGMAFQIVDRGDRRFHIYGKGENRQVIEVSQPKSVDDDKKPSDASPSDGKPSEAEGTGGTRASS
jgi:hypothetical protein